MFASLEKRIRGLHPALASVKFTHRWGGPILFRDDWRPVFDFHPQSRNGIVVGAYAGHGVALSSYLGAWAAEALLGRRGLPDWGQIPAERYCSRWRRSSANLSIWFRETIEISCSAKSRTRNWWRGLSAMGSDSVMAVNSHAPTCPRMRPAV